MTILVVHGPNLNLLGERDPGHYGRLTLAELDARIADYAAANGCAVRSVQSNHEGVLIDALHDARTWADGVVINPGAYGHTSYALRDAIDAIRLPVVEVHLSDVEAREPFRRVSTIAEVCIAKISGRGAGSYLAGIDALVARAAANPPAGNAL